MIGAGKTQREESTVVASKIDGANKCATACVVAAKIGGANICANACVVAAKIDGEVSNIERVGGVLTWISRFTEAGIAVFAQ